MEPKDSRQDTIRPKTEKSILRQDAIRPVIDNEIFYQVETINTFDKFQRIRLDSNFKYCIGIALNMDNGLNSDAIFSIRDRGQFVFDKLPVIFFDNFNNIDNVNGCFLPVNMIADGTYKDILIDDVGGSFDVEIIFLLSNQRPNTKNRKFDYQKVSYVLGDNYGKFYFNYDKTIKNISIIDLSSKAFTISIRNNSRFYLKNLKYSFIDRTPLFSIENRLFKCNMPSDSLSYELNGIGTGTIYFIFEYDI